MVEYKVGKMETGKKVHRLVRQLLPGVPLSGIYKMLRTGRVKLNGKKAKADDIVKVDDVVHLYMAHDDYEAVSKPKKKFVGIERTLTVVFEDEAILVVDKPAGLLVHGAKEEQKDTLVNRVLAYLSDKGELQQQIFTPASVNRLDRNTSGLVLFGKTGDTTRQLALDVAEHRVRKWYLALVEGKLKPSGEIRGNLVRDPERNRTRVAEHGKEALTRYVLQASSRTSSVAKVELVSGRTHQIRAHFESIGHPLWGDVKYNGLRGGETGQHQWLHAAWLQLADGRTFHSPLPAAFKEQLHLLGYTAHQLVKMQEF